MTTLILILASALGTSAYGAVIFPQPVVPFGRPEVRKPSELIKGFADLDRFVTDLGIRSIDELIPKLPAPYLYNYSLIIDSRSPHAASPLHPRVTLFDPSGRLMMAYGGGEHGPRGDVLEVIEFNAMTGRYEFNGLDFSGANPRRFSKDETAQCLRCHGASVNSTYGHPIWESYPDWPDRYGITDRAGAGRLRSTDHLKQSLTQFQAAAADNPRYKHLGQLTSATDTYFGGLNSVFGDLLLKNLNLSVHRLIDEVDPDRLYAQALKNITPLNASDDFVQSLPGADKLAFKDSYNRLFQLVEAGQREHYLAKERRYRRISQLESGNSEMKNLDAERLTSYVRLAFIMERLGLDLNILNLALERGSFATVQGKSSATNFFKRPCEADLIR